MLNKEASATQRFGLLCWNVHKEMEQERFKRHFSNLLRRFDPELLLLQEAVLSSTALHPLAEYHLSSVKNIEFAKYRYGVLSASKFELLCSIPLATTSREFYCATKKSLLITAHSLGNENVLHIVNLHAINFVSHNVFLYELERLFEYLKEIDTPLLVAGDFNTWSKKRLKHLENFAASLQLQHVIAQAAHHIKQHWNKPLDHIFYRGLDLLHAMAIDTAKISDHNPIWAQFSYSALNSPR